MKNYIDINGNECDKDGNNVNDLFNFPEQQPEEVKTILASFDEDNDAYNECERIVKELNAIGWNADYYLQGELFNLQKL